MSAFSRIMVATTDAEPVKRMFTQTRPGRALAGRFVAGDNLNEAVEVGKRLNGNGFLLSLDLLGEEVSDDTSAKGALAEYLDCLDRIQSESLNANISVKLTQLGLSVDRSLAIDAIDQLAERAAEFGTTVTVDMEDSRFTESTVDIYETAQRRHQNLGIALQAYLKRTPADLERLMPLGGHIRLCKGAYVEPPEVAFTVKRAVDAAYSVQLASLMTNEGVKPAIATHDPVLIDETRGLAAQRIAPFEFQMLYGVGTALQDELVGEGHPVRIYLPFGSQWYPYLTRRMAERPANLLFFARALIK